jgi:hypothetical protein
MRSLSFRNYQWMPILDFKIRLPQTYSQLWIVGICEGEILALEMPKDYLAPSYPQQRSMVRRFKFRIPFLEQDASAN